MFKFQTAAPEEVGVSSYSIINALRKIEDRHVPMHGLIIMRHDKLIYEKYYAPYQKDTLHRMFSISKTFTAIAMSILEAEGKISIDDKICDYFPEYVTEDTHRWIKNMTIRNMLEMRTCHAASTYKVDMKTDWVKSFFTVEPTHKPGTVFHYDTSAPHTLAALCEKITGMKMLDYLKEKAFNYLDFSKDSYMVTDPFGVSMGGSGLMATPMDVFKVLYLVHHDGRIVCNDGKERQLINSEFIKRATTNISDTVVTGPIPSECQGYGMQIWMNERGGYVFYGMGGQLAIALPQEDMLIMTTADTQGIAGGNEVIYDAIYHEILDNLDGQSDEAELKKKAGIEVDNTTDSYTELAKFSNSLSIKAPLWLKTGITCYSKDINNEYELDTNDSGFDKLRLQIIDGIGTIDFISNSENDFSLKFGMDEMQQGIFPKYNNSYTAGAVWLREKVLYIRFNLIGESVGSVHLELYIDDNDITVFMKKVEETYFNEFKGHLYGRLK